MAPKLSPDATDVAREVYVRMLAKGIGQKALAKLAGLNDTYVRDMLAGKSKNQLTAQLQKLATALDCNVADLTGPSSIDPRLREFIQPDKLLPLHPGEVGLIWLWRKMDDPSRDQILNHATALLAQNQRNPKR